MQLPHALGSVHNSPSPTPSLRSIPIPESISPTDTQPRKACTCLPPAAHPHLPGTVAASRDVNVRIQARARFAQFKATGATLTIKPATQTWSPTEDSRLMRAVSADSTADGLDSNSNCKFKGDAFWDQVFVRWPGTSVYLQRTIMANRITSTSPYHPRFT